MEIVDSLWQNEYEMNIGWGSCPVESDNFFAIGVFKDCGFGCRVEDIADSWVQSVDIDLVIRIGTGFEGGNSWGELDISFQSMRVAYFEVVADSVAFCVTKGGSVYFNDSPGQISSLEEEQKDNAIGEGLWFFWGYRFGYNFFSYFQGITYIAISIIEVHAMTFAGCTDQIFIHFCDSTHKQSIVTILTRFFSWSWGVNCDDLGGGVDLIREGVGIASALESDCIEGED